MANQSPGGGADRKADYAARIKKAWDTRGRKRISALYAKLVAAKGGGAPATTPKPGEKPAAGGMGGTDVADAWAEARVRQIRAFQTEPTTKTPPPPFTPDVERDADGDGVTDAARVGVPADMVPPPPKVPRLPNLTKTEREHETAFAEAFEKDPDGMAKKFLEMVKKSDKPNTFEADGAKNLYAEWAGKEGGSEARSEFRATMNTALHQTANAIAKRAFLMHLDSMTDEEKAKGLLVTVGGCGCHAPGTMVMLSDGSVRAVEDVHVGERLMGPDSKPREILRTIRGAGQMYRVVPTKGEPFIVNEDHVLSLRTTRARGSRKRSQLVTVEMSVKDILKRGHSFRRLSMLYRVGVEYPPAPVPLNPYFLGLWLGDGTGINTTITTADPEVAAFVATMAESTPGVRLAVRDKKDNKAKGYQMVATHAGRQPGGDYATNPVLAGLRELGVSPEHRDRNDGGNDQNGSRLKHIPAQYLHNSREVRLELLAGLLDSDGYLDRRGTAFDLVTRWRALADGISTLARSLGLACYVKPCRKSAQTGHVGDYYRLSISGDTHEIPTRIERKRAHVRRQQRMVLHTGFTLELLGEGSYYGFTLDGDGLYLLRDFTVTRNSGKGFALKQLKGQFPELDAGKRGAVWDSAGDQNATENPWLLKEATKRGIKVTYAYVSADPEVSWADEGEPPSEKKPKGRPARGVVKRAEDPNDGRMVDAHVFADSYVIGAKNHAAFHKKHAKDANFLFLDNSGDAKVIFGVPESDLKRDRRKLLGFAQRTLITKAKKIPQRVKRGAMVGSRIWKGAAA